MESNLTETVVYWIGVITGALFGGVICGLLPYLIGIKREQRTLGIIALVIASIIGVILGFIYALIVALIFTAVIALRKKNSSL
ncbi:MAG: hypothetical protein N4A64_10790 [Marinisporobacter sp.]|jgi:integral membrane sensor domain MASE1|nr:hypothetical protein [Marinisporobacter sp.]